MEDWRRYVWAWLAVSTRCIHLGRNIASQIPAPQDTVALAPFLDFLNHSNEARVTTSFDLASRQFVIRTLTPYKRGCEVFISYGPHDNSFMLAEYGFVLAGNPFQGLELDHYVDAWVATARSNLIASTPGRPAAMQPSDVDHLIHTIEQRGLWRDFVLSPGDSDIPYRLHAALRLLIVAAVDPQHRRQPVSLKREIARWERWLRGEHVDDGEAISRSGMRYFSARSALRADDASESNPSSASSADEPKKTLPQKASHIVRSILHGSEQVRQETKDTLSKVLARGKYVHELAVHDVKPGRMDEYKSVVAELYPRIVRNLSPKVKLVGSWETDIGDLDTAIHVWEYQGYPALSEAYTLYKTESAYRELHQRLLPLLRKRNSQVMLEFKFWQTHPPVTKGGVYELRSYMLKPGTLLEWEQNWRVGVECRRHHEEPMGAWFSQLGDLNQVHHLWQYPDLHVRKKVRESAWSENGWPETVLNTVPLIQRMSSRIMLPMSFSSLK
ncbi:hypothetical protein EV177_002715 [Coemansia sp. RSA 1804]|nr:hypothetical protein EV177_002715 [Coemansia sp. RSA 1804]